MFPDTLSLIKSVQLIVIFIFCTIHCYPHSLNFENPFAQKCYIFGLDVSILTSPSIPIAIDSWKKYLENINKAVAAYKDCPNEKIGCFKRQIDVDLKIWKDKGGIPKEDFDNALNRKAGEHYQIINHKLYRQEDCIFPFRYFFSYLCILRTIKYIG